MTTLQFANNHHLVTFLSKPAESEGFEQIVDFLKANPIRYALTINPTIYTSIIVQFWVTVKAKTINGEVQLQALVDGKKIIITELIVRIDLQQEDAEGIDCLPNATIFKQLTLMGYEKVSQKFTFYKAFFSPQWKFLIHIVLQCLSAKTTAWNEFSSTMASAIICEAINEEIYDNLERVATTATSLDADQDRGGSPRHQETMGDTIAQTRSENVSTHFNDPLLARGNTLQSGEDRLKLEEVMEFCTKLQQRVLDMENTKTAQAQEITSLKLRVKKLEKKGGSRIHKLKRLYKVMDEKDINVAEKEVSIADSVTTTGEVVTTASPTKTTTVDDLTLAQTLIEIRSAKSKVKGVVIGEQSESTTRTRPQQLPLKDKGKGIMEEPEKNQSNKQISNSYDEEVAQRLQA
ncbi:hypothetical protein Tco_0088936 [Tanacetum coccineum]